MTALERRIAVLRAAFDAEIEKIAEEVRKKYVIPACKKYNLTFSSGNGSFAFYGVHDGREVNVGWAYPEEAKKYGWALKCAFKALNTEVDYNSNIGHYVMDVRL